MLSKAATQARSHQEGSELSHLTGTVAGIRFHVKHLVSRDVRSRRGVHVSGHVSEERSLCIRGSIRFHVKRRHDADYQAMVESPNLVFHLTTRVVRERGAPESALAGRSERWSATETQDEIRAH